MTGDAAPWQVGRVTLDARLLVHVFPVHVVLALATAAVVLPSESSASVTSRTDGSSSAISALPPACPLCTDTRTPIRTVLKQ